MLRLLPRLAKPIDVPRPGHSHVRVQRPAILEVKQQMLATGLNLGTGVAVQATTRIDSQGTLQSTSNALDLALDGDGYFQVTMPGGQLAYTRAGNFSRSA